MTTIREQNTVDSPDGTRISFVRSGAGSPVLLVHGGATDASSLVLIARDLAVRNTVLLMDRRGRADPVDPEGYAIEREYEDVIAVAETAGEPVVVFAHSYGGLCTLGAAASRPDLFRSIVLYEPPIPTPGQPIASHDVIARVDRAISEDHRDLAATTFLREVVKLQEREVESLRATSTWRDVVGHAHVLRCEGRGVNAYVIDDRAMARVIMPVTMVLGSVSHPQYAAAAEALGRALPHMTTVVVEGQGHLATAFAPEAIVRVLLS